jgi:hypothetical protein
MKREFLGFRSILLTLLIALLGCEEGRVTANQLSGTWVISEDSKQRAAVVPNAIPKVILNENGTFVVSELPGEVLYRQSSDERVRLLVSGGGRWKLVLKDGRQFVQLDFQTIVGAKESDVPYGTHLGILSTSAGPILYYFHGHIDEGIRIKLAKVLG